MKKIIVPTDFSYSSRYAFVYATKLAKIFELSVEVIHLYMGSFNPQQSFTIHAGKGREGSLMEDLKAFTTIEDKNGNLITFDVPITHKVIFGQTEVKLIQLSKELETALIVMGMKGAGATTLLFGSISRAVSQKAHCPVLLIPKGAVFTDFDQILYASNYDSMDVKSMRKAIQWGNRFDSDMHFVHVNNDDQQREYETIQANVMDIIYADGEPTYPFNISMVYDESIVKGLTQYIDNNGIDLAIIVTQHRTFWKSILHQSVSKQMSRVAHIPILVYHLLQKTEEAIV